MDGAVVGAGCGAVGEGSGDEVGVYGGGFWEGGEGGFHGEGVGAQPGEESCFSEEAGVCVLRGMGVCVWVLLEGCS